MISPQKQICLLMTGHSSMYCCWTAAIYISELTFFLSSAFAETLLTNHFRVPRFNLELAFPIRHIVVVTSGCEATKA